MPKKKRLKINLDPLIFPTLADARRYTETVYKEVAHGTGYVFKIECKYLKMGKVKTVVIEWGHKSEDKPGWKSSD